MATNIERRKFIAALSGTAIAWPIAARAQQLAGRTARIGFLGLDNPVVSLGYPAFLDELKKSGFSEGQNLVIEAVRTDQDAQRLFAETADLVRSNVELLVVIAAEPALQAAVAASRTIPIVMWAVNFDPIARGYVKSLARPGGNITGVVSLQTELAAKQVELLTQAFPERTRLAVLWDGQFGRPVCRCGASGEIATLGRPVAETGKPALRFRCSVPEPRRRLSANASRALQSVLYSFPLAYRRAGDPATVADHVHLQGLRPGRRTYVLRRRPCGHPRQVGFYVAKILNGAKPADLPVQQAVKFELVINLKTAKALGVELSTAIQLRADEVIE